MNNTTIQTCLAAAIGCAAAIVLAADVPWVFTGDTTRSPASAASSSSSAAFVSWTHESKTVSSPGIAFSSFKPGTVMIFR